MGGKKVEQSDCMVNSFLLELEDFAKLAHPIDYKSPDSTVAAGRVEELLGLNLLLKQILEQQVHLTMRFEERFLFSSPEREFFPVRALEEAAVTAVAIVG